MYKTINYSRGGQPTGAKSIIFFFVGIFFIVLIILFLINGKYLPALLAFPFIAIVFFIAADFQGVEINLEQNKIREYQITLLGRTGDWMNYQHFSIITLNQATFKTQDTMNYNEPYVEQHSYFIVELVNLKDNIKLILGEHGDYNAALELMKTARKQLKLDTHNKFQERLYAAKQQRRH